MTAATLPGPATAATSQMRPTIKGVFVNSHVRALRRAKGEEAVRELERRMGQRLDFRDLDDVLVRDEVRLIEHALDLLEPEVPPGDRAFEAGRLHFRNFSTTPLARLVFGIFPRNFRYMMLRADTIAERVFKGVSFKSTDLGDNAVRVIMERNDYPIEHFQGLFHEWMVQFGYHGDVEAVETAPDRFEYTMRWNE